MISRVYFSIRIIQGAFALWFVACGGVPSSQPTSARKTIKSERHPCPPDMELIQGDTLLRVVPKQEVSPETSRYLATLPRMVPSFCVDKVVVSREKFNECSHCQISGHIINQCSIEVEQFRKETAKAPLNTPIFEEAEEYCHFRNKRMVRLGEMLLATGRHPTARHPFRRDEVVPPLSCANSSTREQTDCYFTCQPQVTTFPPFIQSFLGEELFKGDNSIAGYWNITMALYAETNLYVDITAAVSPQIGGGTWRCATSLLATRDKCKRFP
jgi:hypothetical protein